MRFRRWGSVVLAGCLSAAALPAWGAHTGGLAAPLRAGGFAVSTTLGYAERDVRDGRDDEVASRRILLRAEAGVADGLDVYALVGLSDAEFDRADFEGGLGESLGAGLRYGLVNFDEPGVKLVVDVQGEYFRSEDGSVDVRHQAYHVALYALQEVGAAGRVGYLYPYGGLRASYARYDGDGGGDFTGDDLLGVFAGLDYFVSPNVFFSGEAHLFDEASLYLGVGYRF